MTIQNLDFYCVDFAQHIADTLLKEDNPVSGDDVAQFATRFLGILHANGLYATLLYTVWKRYNGTKRERRVAAAVDEQLVGKPGQQSLLRLDAMQFSLNESQDALAVGRTLSQNLENIFLAKDLLNRTMTYVRYHGKTG
ncbi:hypothetical protein QUF58_00640 [Anaerolineales bacterium HSG24]|nr:hypothetical protein [Anaerolineales bacterium HSG24]